MLNIRKILVPVDFSEPSVQAARYARDLGAKFSAELTLLHVLPPLRFEYAMAKPAGDRFGDLLAARHGDVERALDELAGQISGEQVSREVVEGDAAEQIIRCAHNGGYDAVVMSTRGAGPLRRWLLVGSVTSKVLYGAECPVISCSCFDDRFAPVPPRHVVCAIDLGPQSERALRFSADVAKMFEAGLTVVHAATVPGDAAHDLFDETWRGTLVSRLQSQIESLQKKLRTSADVVVETGDPPAAVAAAARRLGAGLVVLGRGASTDFIGRIKASGYDIIREAPCPVITV
jgi:nucleotide-binding universal stress UspA family protein